MRYKPDQKEQTRKRLIEAAEQCFKEGGYGGIGVDGLAKKAGVTSGAFYGQFKSKEEAFGAAISSGLDVVKTGIEHLQREHGDAWWGEFIKFYMGQKRECDLTESCALQSLSPEVARSSETIRAVFEDELMKIFDAANKGPANTGADTTWATLAMLVGGVTLARAVADPKLANDIAAAVEKEVIQIHQTSTK